MSQKMVFQNTDKQFYIATYTDNGDFSSISEKGYETANLANSAGGLPEGTPTGEYVKDDVEVEAQVPAPVVEETPTAPAEVSTETVPTEPVAPEASAEVTPEVTAPVEPTPTEPVAETTVEPTAEVVAPTEPTEPVAPVEPTEPAVVA